MKEDDLRKKLLRILYISQYFPPEIGATQTRAYEMTRYLTAAGHRVTGMLTTGYHRISPR